MDVCLFYFILFSLVWFGVCDLGAAGVGCVGRLCPDPFPDGFRQLSETRIELIK